MGLVAGDPASLTPIAQEALGDGPLDEQLAAAGVRRGRARRRARARGARPAAGGRGGARPTSTTRRPPPPSTPSAARSAWSSASTRGGGQACVLRLRGATPEQDERVTGPDLAPALAAALLATLDDG